MSRTNVDEQFGMDSDPKMKDILLNALQLVKSVIESESDGCAETFAALKLLHVDNVHLAGLMKRIEANGGENRIRLTLGDHILIYTSHFLFTRLYSEELTSHMLQSMDDMDRMHLDEPEIYKLRMYADEMKRTMKESKERFASFPLFTKHLETLDIVFPIISA